jgi:hypothetical protein
VAVEATLQRSIVEYLRGRAHTYVLNVGGGASTAKGTPDLLVCHRGRFVALEVKRPDGAYGLTTPQEMRIAAIRRAGGTAEVVTSIADVTALLDSLKGR